MDYSQSTTSGYARHTARQLIKTITADDPFMQFDVSPENFSATNFLYDKYEFFNVRSLKVYANPVGGPIKRSSNLAIGINADSGNNLLDSNDTQYASNILRLKSSKLLQKDSVGEYIASNAFKSYYYCKQAGVRRFEVPLVINAVLLSATPIEGRLSPWKVYAVIEFEFRNPTQNFPFSTDNGGAFAIDFSESISFEQNFADLTYDISLNDQSLVEGSTLSFDASVQFDIDYLTSGVVNVSNNTASVVSNTGGVSILRFNNSNLLNEGYNELITLGSIQSLGVITGTGNE